MMVQSSMTAWLEVSHHLKLIQKLDRNTDPAWTVIQLTDMHLVLGVSLTVFSDFDNSVLTGYIIDVYAKGALYSSLPLC